MHSLCQLSWIKLTETQATHSLTVNITHAIIAFVIKLENMLMAHWSSGLRHRPLTAVTGVRIPYGSPDKASAFMQVLLIFLFWDSKPGGRERKQKSLNGCFTASVGARYRKPKRAAVGDVISMHSMRRIPYGSPDKASVFMQVLLIFFASGFEPGRARI